MYNQAAKNQSRALRTTPHVEFNFVSYVIIISGCLSGLRVLDRLSRIITTYKKPVLK
jgi:TRAP-type C4-dicarboxylate transport system permease small subunit